MTDNHFQTLDDVRDDLIALYRESSSYIAAGAKKGISGGLTWSIINKGYEPKTNLTRAKLNLAPLMAPAPVCTNPDCKGYGKPHTYDCSTQVVKPKPAKTRKRTTRRRVVAYPDLDQQDRIRELAAENGMNISQYILFKCLDGGE